jgi:hypothetical protein
LLVLPPKEATVIHLHSCDGEGLEEKRKRRPAARKSTVEESDTRDDEPHEEGAHHQVDIVELKASVLGVDILIEGVASVGLGRVKLGLQLWSAYCAGFSEVALEHHIQGEKITYGGGGT